MIITLSATGEPPVHSVRKLFLQHVGFPTLRYSSLSLSFSASMVVASSSSVTLPAFLRLSKLSRQDFPSSNAFDRSTLCKTDCCATQMAGRSKRGL